MPVSVPGAAVRGARRAAPSQRPRPRQPASRVMLRKPGPATSTARDAGRLAPAGPRPARRSRAAGGPPAWRAASRRWSRSRRARAPSGARPRSGSGRSASVEREVTRGHGRAHGGQHGVGDLLGGHARKAIGASRLLRRASASPRTRPDVRPAAGAGPSPTSSSGSNGFVTYASTPASRPACRSAACARAVTITMGMPAVARRRLQPRRGREPVQPRHHHVHRDEVRVDLARPCPAPPARRWPGGPRCPRAPG